jgi:hypothetical protein
LDSGEPNEQILFLVDNLMSSANPYKVVLSLLEDLICSESDLAEFPKEALSNIKPERLALAFSELRKKSNTLDCG